MMIMIKLAPDRYTGVTCCWSPEASIDRYVVMPWQPTSVLTTASQGHILTNGNIEFSL